MESCVPCNNNSDLATVIAKTEVAIGTEPANIICDNSISMLRRVASSNINNVIAPYKEGDDEAIYNFPCLLQRSGCCSFPCIAAPAEQYLTGVSHVYMHGCVDE